MNKLKIAIVLITLFFLSSCSSSESTQKDKDQGVKLDKMDLQEVRLDVHTIKAWLNLMPGASSKFHISGEILVTENFKYDLNFIKLERIIVSQDDQQIYNIVPTVQVDPDQSTHHKKYFRFATINGLSRDPRLNIDKTLNLKMVFDDGEETYSYYLNDVQLDKVY